LEVNLQLFGPAELRYSPLWQQQKECVTEDNALNVPEADVGSKTWPPLIAPRRSVTVQGSPGPSGDSGDNG
ncbi:hypothetical protein NQZ68_041867, partial [Dissostichus eleginoides]